MYEQTFVVRMVMQLCYVTKYFTTDNRSLCLTDMKCTIMMFLFFILLFIAADDVTNQFVTMETPHPKHCALAN